MFDYVPDGQFSFSDYCNKPKLDIKPKPLVEFINSSGTAQYAQIGNVVQKTCEYNHYQMPDDSISRITNDVSVWLLRVGSEYEKYLKELLGN